MARTWAFHATVSARVTLVAGAVAVCLLGAVQAVGSAQGSPPAPIDPAECVAEPRALPLWDATPPALATSEQPDPETGEPADEATIRGITGTIEDSTACANAGQPLRVLALVTDDFLARQFIGDGAADVTEVGARLERPEPPPDPTEYLGIVAIEDVVLYPDGSVGAVVVTANAFETFRDYVVFVQGEDRWLIDASFALDTTPATPRA